MSAAGIDWEQLPDAVVEAFIERLHLVEILLDPLLPAADKRAEQRHYQQQHGVGERTIRGYLHRYRKRGPRSLLFYRPRPTSARVHDAALPCQAAGTDRRAAHQKRLATAQADRRRRQTRRQARAHLGSHPVSLSGRPRPHPERPLPPARDDSRTSFRSFEAPHTLALVQADARDGIWCVFR